MWSTQSGCSPFASGAASHYGLALNISQAAYQIVTVFQCLLPKRDEQQFMATFYGPNLVYFR